MPRHGRLETITNPDGTFHLRIVAANGRILAHSEQLTGRQVERARRAILRAVAEDERARLDECKCAACGRERRSDGTSGWSGRRNI